MLHCSFNAIDDKGAAALAASLASNAKLRHLWLSGNPITGDGAEALNRTLSSNRTIEQIRLTISNDMYREMLSGHTGQGFKLLGAQPHRTSIHFKVPSRGAAVA